MEEKINNDNEQKLQQQLDENELDQVTGGFGGPPVPHYTPSPKDL